MRICYLDLDSALIVIDWPGFMQMSKSGTALSPRLNASLGLVLVIDSHSALCNVQTPPFWKRRKCPTFLGSHFSCERDR
jgi:hypothetical protein